MCRKLLEKLETFKLPNGSYDFKTIDASLLKKIIKCRSADTNTRFEALYHLLIYHASTYRFAYFQLKNDHQLRRKLVDVLLTDEEKLKDLVKEARYSYDKAINIFRLLSEVDKVVLALTKPHMIRDLREVLTSYQ